MWEIIKSNIFTIIIIVIVAVIPGILVYNFITYLDDKDKVMEACQKRHSFEVCYYLINM